MNSILRWAGSKRQLVSKLRTFWPGGQTRYIEPFCGSSCLFFALEPSSAILGDVNGQLMEFYEAIRGETDKVIACFETLKGGKRHYYDIRGQNPKRLGITRRAARFLYLNRYCFNGIYRTNTKGEFNVPYGPQKSDAALNMGGLRKAAKALAVATLVSGDFSQCLHHARSSDFVYLDPPYAVGARRVFREYHPDSFHLRDLGRLAWWLRQLDRRGVFFVVSYADCAEARNTFAPWHACRVKTRRHIAGFADRRRFAYELVVTNMLWPRNTGSENALGG